VLTHESRRPLPWLSFDVGKMKTAPRVLANLLFPPGIAVLLLWSVGGIFGEKFPSFVRAILVAYIVAAIPSVIHAFAMERFYRRGVLPTRMSAVGISALSGLFAGILVAAIFLTVFPLSSALKLWPYPLVGTATGAIVALLILALSHAPKCSTNH
jgi:hypothetical protein